MTIDIRVVILEQPYGNPGSIGEPLGLWLGAAMITGDVSGGSIQLAFVPRNPTDTPTLDDARREYVYFCDGAAERALDSLGPGGLRVQYESHPARPNTTLTRGMRHIFVSNRIAINGEQGHMTPIYADYVARFPMFWDSQELSLSNNTLVQFREEVNNNAQNYEFQAWGRYYDRQILSNRAFGRLISPPAVSQFPL